MRQTIFQSGDLSIEVAPDATPQALIFKFPAQFTSDICDSAIEVWSQFCDDSDKPYHHVWDCSGMTSFEMAAKKSWQRQMDKCANSIDHISLISDVVISISRGAARLMSKFVKLDLKVFKNLSELHL